MKPTNMRYSLSNYSVSVTTLNGHNITFGGKGSYLGSIKVERSNDRFSISADDTGGYVFNEKHNRSGSVTISFTMVAPIIESLFDLFAKYDVDYQSGGSDYRANIVVRDSIGRESAIIKDCYIQNLPAMDIGSEAGTKDFTFVCGDVDLKYTNK